MAPRTIESVRTFLANPEEIRRIVQLVHSFIYEDMAECGDEAFALLTNEYGKTYLAIDKSAEAAFAVEISMAPTYLSKASQIGVLLSLHLSLVGSELSPLMSMWLEEM